MNFDESDRSFAVVWLLCGALIFPPIAIRLRPCLCIPTRSFFILNSADWFYVYDCYSSGT